jgi:hypothetical protein
MKTWSEGIAPLFLTSGKFHYGFVMDQYGWKVNKIAGISVEQFMVYVEIPFIALCKLGFIMDK